MKRSLIIGIYGEIGIYLSGILVQNGYVVKGTIATDWLRSGDDETAGSEELPFHSSIEMIRVRYRDHGSWSKIIYAFRPDEIYILTPLNTRDQNQRDTVNIDLYEPFIVHILDLVKELRQTYRPRIFHACGSDLFGLPDTIPQSELTPLRTDDPAVKPILRSFLHCRAYREAYGINASNGILTDCLSVYQSEFSFERYVSKTLAEVVLGRREAIPVGNLSIKRDRIHAWDCANGIHHVMQQRKTDDYLFASGISSTREVLLFHSAKPLGMTLRFITLGDQRLGFLTDLDERKFTERVGEKYLAKMKSRIISSNDLKSRKKVARDKAFVISKPSDQGRVEAPFILGDYSKAKRELNWTPQYHFADVIKEMVMEDLVQLRGLTSDEEIRNNILSVG